MVKTKINIPFLETDEISQYAMDALSKYSSRYNTELPINPEKLLETEYGVEIIPIQGLRIHNVECSLSRNSKIVYVDQEYYENNTMSNRLAFTFAHELGHKILHTNYLSLGIQLERLETQANMFAARFLMPETVLLGVIASEIIERFDSIASNELTLQSCIEYQIGNLAKYFGVSQEAMRNRIKNINLQQILTGPFISTLDKEKFSNLANTVSKTDNQWKIQLSRITSEKI